MRWAVRRLGVALLALAGAAGAAAQEITIDDRRLAEQNSTWQVPFNVILSAPSAQAITVVWSTSDGSAKAGLDYNAVVNGSLTIPAGSIVGSVLVTIRGNGAKDSDARTFHVNLLTTTSGTLKKKRAVGTILDDDGNQPPAPYLIGATAGATSPTATLSHWLQWKVPVSTTAVESFRIRWTTGDACSPLSSPTSGGDPTVDVTGSFPGDSTQRYELPNQTAGTLYCYSLFAKYASGGFSAAATVVLRAPVDASGRVKWVYATGETGTALEAATVTYQGIFTVDSKGVVHAIGRGAAFNPGGGSETALWPSAWNPLTLAYRAHARSFLVPLPAGPRLFVSTEKGEVNSINAENGSLVWTVALSPNFGASAQAGPAAVFKMWGGQHDILVVGTGAGNGNVVWGLDPSTGGLLSSWDAYPADLQAISSMGATDYVGPNNRAYFLSRDKAGEPDTVVALDLGPPGTDSLTKAWSAVTGPSDGSPILVGRKLYHGDNASKVYALDADSGSVTSALALSPADGPVKNFAWPDRANGDLYVSTTNRVYKIHDGPPLVQAWATPAAAPPGPSHPVFLPGTTRLYVGASDGRVYRLSTADGTVADFVDLKATAAGQVGAPAYDSGYDLVVVGSGNAVFGVRF